MYPLSNFLELRLKINRTATALIIVLVLVTIFVSIWALLVPIIYHQITDFVQYMPEHQVYLKNNILKLFSSHIDVSYTEKLTNMLDSLFSEISRITLLFLSNFWKSGIILINGIVVLVLVPMITFYMIKDWNSFRSKVIGLIPISKKKSFTELMSEINSALSEFIRGQLNICLILAAYYSISLSIIGVNFGILIGLTTGLLSFVPLLGILGGFLVAVVTSLFQHHGFHGILLISIVFILGNILETVIGPRLIGKKIGVNPIFIVFFALLGGSLFGFIGMFFAVPLCTIAAVLIKFTIKQYRNSVLYKN